MKDDTISRAAAVDALDALCDRECEYSKKQRNVMCGACHLGTAFDVIEQLPSAQQWIPCEERLPEPGVNVLVDVLDIPAGDCFPLVDKIGDDGDWCNCYGEWLAVAWVPIPDPWEGENDG